MNIVKPVTTLVNSDSLDFIQKTRTIYDIKEISENTNLITFDKAVNPTVCSEFGVDPVEALE
jgi:hypothetical protein